MDQNISVVLPIIWHSIKLVYNDKMLHGSDFLCLFTIITGNKFKRYELQKHIQTIGRNVKDLLFFMIILICIKVNKCFILQKVYNISLINTNCTDL